MGQQGEESVPNDAFVLRLVHPKQFNRTAPSGSKIQTSALQTKEFTPPNRPSLWVEERASLEQIIAAEPRFADRGVVRIQVREIRRMGLDVVYSPDECDIPKLRTAHASLLQVTKDNRDTIVESFERFLIKEPA